MRLPPPIRCDGSSPTIVNCAITGNTVSYPAAGGGIACAFGSNPTITNCTICGNSATGSSGGGIFCWSNSDPTITNCLITGNTAVNGGGGVHFEDTGNAYPRLINCTMTGNQAAYGGAVCCYGVCYFPTITNCILWGDSPDEINVISGSPIVTYSNVAGGTGEPWFSPGCIDADPLFVDPANDDHHILPGSPCIDAADNTAVPPDEADLDEDGDKGEPTPLDLDYNPRFVDDPDTPTTGVGSAEHPDPEIVDMGAYEFPVPASYWQAGTDDWGIGPNWTAGEPTAGVAAYISNGGTAQIIQPGEVCQSLWLGELLGDIGTVELLAFGELSATEQYIGVEGIGTFTQTGGTNSVSNALYLGYYSPSDGTYNLSGGDLSASTVHVGYDYDGTAAFNWTGGTLDANTINIRSFGTMAVGQNWTYDGTLNISGGDVTLGAHNLILDAPGVGAAVALSSGTLSTDNQTFGEIYSATCTQTYGTNTIDGDLYLGDQTGSDGAYTMTDGSLDVSAGSITVGRGGTGSLDLNGGTVQCVRGVIGADSGSQGTLTVDGINALWTDSDGLYIGGDPSETGGPGSGGLIVQNDADVTSRTGRIAYESGSQGMVTVTGAGSEWIIGFDMGILDYLAVGEQGLGTLNITNGGLVHSFVGSVGKSLSHIGGAGAVYIDGIGSTLECPMWFAAGGGGAGSATIAISNGGHIQTGSLAAYSSGSISLETGSTISSNTVYIKALSGFQAAASVDGTGSVWTNTGSFYVSDIDSSGELTISNDGTVNVGDALEVWANGTVNLNGGLIIADDVYLEPGATFNPTGGTLRVNTLSGFGDNAAFGGGLQIGHAGGIGSGSHTVSLFQSLATGGSLAVGYDAPGALTVQGGGDVSSYAGYIGYEPTGNGSVTVTGNGSTWSNLGLYVGFDGTGSLTIQNGAAVSNGAAEIGTHGGANGTVMVEGSGSTWTASFSMFVGGDFSGPGGTGGLTVDNGATVDVAETLKVWDAGTVNVDDGSIVAGTVYLDGGGALNLSNAGAGTTVSSLLRFGINSTFTAVPDSTIHMTGADFENESTNEVDLAGLANLNLIFEGGVAQADDLEVACEDKGSVTEGYDINFALGKLTVGGADIGKARLVDNTDNGNRGGTGGSTEALYVDSLVLNAGSVLDLNNLNLYWRTEFIDNGGTILNGYPNHVGVLGDLNCDGSLDLADVSPFVTRMTDPTAYANTYPDCPVGNADFNNDGLVNGLDIQEFVSLILST